MLTTEWSQIQLDKMQTVTPRRLAPKPDKAALIGEYVGKPLDALRTPAFVIDRSIFAQNCARMHQNAKNWGAGFRAHIKTHKTLEGTRLQLNSSEGKTEAIVVSTLMEAWSVVDGGLVADGTVKDILYGLPVGFNKVADLSALSQSMAAHGGVIRIIIDHPEQVRFLEEFERQQANPKRWSAFIKVDNGGKRAGVVPTAARFEDLVTTALSSSAISVYGFYSHAGNSYASKTSDEATSFLSAEVEAVNTAAGLALSVMAGSVDAGSHNTPFILSVGSTPTAHAATAATREKLAEALNGQLELHAGNYPMLDLQQLHTGMIEPERIAQKVVATVISFYPGRGDDGEDEAMCDAGAIAMSKDHGPIKGFGQVIGKPWILRGISQEHGLLLQTSGGIEERLKLGETIEIIGQHACLIAASYPWYYITDSSTKDDKVVDVWVPCKGW